MTCVSGCPAAPLPGLLIGTSHRSARGAPHGVAPRTHWSPSTSPSCLPLAPDPASEPPRSCFHGPSCPQHCPVQPSLNPSPFSSHSGRCSAGLSYNSTPFPSSQAGSYLPVHLQHTTFLSTRLMTLVLAITAQAHSHSFSGLVSSHVLDYFRRFPPNIRNHGRSPSFLPPCAGCLQLIICRYPDTAHPSSPTQMPLFP